MARTPGSTTTTRRAPDARQRAWAIMRYLGEFTDGDIISTAEMGASNFRKYRARLVEAGYLREIKARKSGYRMEDARYQLIRDTGRKHPIVRKDGVGVYDQNKKEIYGHPRSHGSSAAPADLGNLEGDGLVSGT